MADERKVKTTIVAAADVVANIRGRHYKRKLLALKTRLFFSFVFRRLLHENSKNGQIEANKHARAIFTFVSAVAADSQSCG